MTDQPQWADMIKSALAAMKQGPRQLAAMVSMLADTTLSSAQLIDFLESAQPNDPSLVQLRVSIASWDAEVNPLWLPASSSDHEPGSLLRRDAIASALGLDEERSERLRKLVPIDMAKSIVIAKEFEPWYAKARHSRSTMYWDDYVGYLAETRQWPAESLASLDETTTEVVQRISDPQRLEARQTKGLVVGYVQSGKTANFTGVIAKAIDSGYRFIIVLTGTIELLRSQTQHRLDMELVGRENILDGQDPENPEVVRELDYQQDKDWIADRFIRHGEPLEHGAGPRIRRLTTHHKDYRRLPQGKTQLRFDGLARGKPLNDPENLARASTYLAVVKKNQAALKKLIQDIKPSKHLDNLPILIIDDESDLASVDTTNPAHWSRDSAGNRSRTTINRLISELLGLCPRAQYVGYTATPFANVFIDPDDDEDLFPSNFLLSLRRPPGYMGVSDFHDLNLRWDDAKPNFSTSNRVAYVRPLVGDPESDPDKRNSELREAVDSFVLAGAIKKFREARTPRRFKHHTMLVHESVKTADHAETFATVERLWKTGGYGMNSSVARLRKLWKCDHSKVSAVRSDGEPVPSSFDELLPYLGEAIAKLTEDGVPITVVNSDKEIQNNQKRIDFESEDVWRILVGGAQLSRGFTIEGLTVSYFRRRAHQADTLMQAGRWFGFRPGYRDLVRLYIRRDDTVDLYEAFEALLLDEESFRLELEQYAGLTDDGHPLVEPWQVPPLVSQHLPWLRPTARNKMWNARVDEKSVGGHTIDLYTPPGPADPNRDHNLEQVGLPLLKLATDRAMLAFDAGSTRGKLEVLTGLVTAQDMLLFLDPRTGMRWHDEYAPTFGPTLKFIRSATAAGRIKDWLIVWPQTKNSFQTAHFAEPVPRVERSRRRGRNDFVGSDRTHRDVAERIVGTPKDLVVSNHGYDKLMSESRTRGVVLVYLARDAGHGDDLVLLSLVLPSEAAGASGARIRWAVERPALAGHAAVQK